MLLSASTRVRGKGEDRGGVNWCIYMTEFSDVVFCCVVLSG